MLSLTSFRFFSLSEKVLDQSLGHWVALEQIIHQHCRSTEKVSCIMEKSHRRYAVIFWGDSCEYLSKGNLKPCMHRVAKCNGERYSVVFKQRCYSPSTKRSFSLPFLLSSLSLFLLRSCGLFGCVSAVLGSYRNFPSPYMS
jgi:hypothetical protein